MGTDTRRCIPASWPKIGDRVQCPDSSTGIVIDIDGEADIAEVAVFPLTKPKQKHGLHLLKVVHDPGDFLMHESAVGSTYASYTVATSGGVAAVVPLGPMRPVHGVVLSRDRIVELEKRTRKEMKLRVFGPKHLTEELERIGMKDCSVTDPDEAGRTKTVRFSGKEGSKQVVSEVLLNEQTSYEDALSILWLRLHRPGTPPLDTLGEHAIITELKQAQEKIRRLEERLGEDAPEQALEAPVSVLANGGCVRLPEFVQERIGVKDGDGVVFWNAKDHDQGVVIVSNDTAAKALGWTTQFDLGDRIQVTNGDECVAGLVVQMDGDSVRLRINREGNWAIVNVSSEGNEVLLQSRCPSHYQGAQCEREAGHTGIHWSFNDAPEPDPNDHYEWVQTPDTDLRRRSAGLWADTYAHFVDKLGTEEFQKLLAHGEVKPEFDVHEEAQKWADEAVLRFLRRTNAQGRIRIRRSDNTDNM
jgi:PAS domain-containing protein